VEVVKEMGSLGFFGACMPEEYGGINLGHLPMAVLCEEVGGARRRCAWPSTPSAGARRSPSCATARRPEEEVDPGHHLGAQDRLLRHHRANAGSDTLSMKSTAKPTSDGFLLNGNKT